MPNTHCIIRILTLILVSFFTSFFVIAQNESVTLNALEGLTETILIDGQPALRILSSKSGAVEIKLSKRDGKDALEFAVTRLQSFGFGVKPADEGKLYITNNHVTYVPYLKKKSFFKASHSEVQNLRLK